MNTRLCTNVIIFLLIMKSRYNNNTHARLTVYTVLSDAELNASDSAMMLTMLQMFVLLFVLLLFRNCKRCH